jgi:hypothetical protein
VTTLGRTGFRVAEGGYQGIFIRGKGRGKEKQKKKKEMGDKQKSHCMEVYIVERSIGTIPVKSPDDIYDSTF